ncbi:hypothetical protein Rhopal_001428-T1 [Rhodotorula paludigena]|uniref:SLC41A/MgtE integral membrane domain-containing protein n=1 Tax=Rhodotorula paludigena TaxID=86838 RepID=A0AAV5GHC7_9BASI|nr:hypothetical protein Rhopal_001428-T1 [Rhodotorula paludigena]
MPPASHLTAGPSDGYELADSSPALSRADKGKEREVEVDGHTDLDDSDDEVEGLLAIRGEPVSTLEESTEDDAALSGTERHAGAKGVDDRPPRAKGSLVQRMLGGMTKQQRKTFTSEMLRETLPVLLLSLVGAVLTGELLQRLQTWRVFIRIEELFILIPILLNLKGNLEMNLAARFSTSANIGELDLRLTRRSLITGNLALLQVQALIVSLISGLIAFILGMASRKGVHHALQHPIHNAGSATNAAAGGMDATEALRGGYFEALLVLCVSMLAAGLSSGILGSFMCSLVVLCRRFRINPDNIATPIASALGDMVTLVILGGLSSLFILFMGTIVSTFVFIALLGVIAVCVYLTFRNAYVQELLTVGWGPLFAAMAISSGSGLVLETYVNAYPGFALVSPVFTALTAVPGAIFVSRISTALHSNRREHYVVVAATLFVLTCPVVLAFLGFVKLTGQVPVTGAFAGGFVVVTMIQTALALVLAHQGSLLLWKLDYDPDVYALPLLTSLLDVTGQLLLVAAYVASGLKGTGSAVAEAASPPCPLASPSIAVAARLESISLELPSPAPATIERLPPELIEAVGKAVCRLTPVGPPTELGHLLVLSRRFYDVLGPKNAGFYADLFKERFDAKSMRRIEEKREKRALLETLPEVKVDTDLQLNPMSSITRPSSPSDFEPDNKSPWRPLTNRDYAAEFKRRCAVLRKMRTAVVNQAIPPSTSRPSSPRLQAFTPRHGRPTLPEPDDLTQNLWTCYLMLLENDGKNLPHLLDYADLRSYMRLFYDHSLLAEALNPGWPRHTAGRALGLWIGWLGGDDLSKETQQESDERFFVLKPYVFAAHKFDAFFAPWTIPSLPVTREDYPVRPPPEGPFFADLRPRSQAQAIMHMGRRIELAPPNLAHAAIFSFFFRVEQDPAVQSDLMLQGHGTPAQHTFGAPLPTTTGAGGQNTLTASSRPTKTSLPELSSRLHDRDFTRLASCIDPYSSLGLPKLYTRGDLTGSWEGRFSFFDFDSYRDMLGGRMRSLYEGPFGDQPQVWKLEERVVRLEPGQKPGGKGPWLNAGFEVGQPGPQRPSFGTAVSQGAAGRSTSRRRESVDAERLGTEDAALRAAKRARSLSSTASSSGAGGSSSGAWWEDDEEAGFDDDPEGEYEILLTGTGHSAWGQFVLKGRVRAWDGMFTIIKEYTPDSRGRWIYRGTLVGGNLVGRWRDTHTPIDLSGYEGTWIMSRRS